MARPGGSYSPILAGWALGSILREQLERAGVDYDAIDVDLIEGYVDGFSTTCATTVSSAIGALGGLYMFDSSNYDACLHFIPRGMTPVMHITSEDVVEAQTAVSKKRRGSIEIPRTLNLEYYDTEGGLTPDKQTSDRSMDNRSTADAKTETVVIMRADDAARAVVIKHKVAIEEARGTVEFTLPDSFIELTVADVITFNGERMRVNQVDIDDGVQKYVCAYDRASAYESSILGVPIDRPSEPPGLIASESRIDIIDCHILASSDDYLGYYAAVSSLSMDWEGAVVELSRDGGVNYAEAQGTRSNAIMGTVSTALPVHSIDYPDWHNSVTVNLLREDMNLTPCTLTDMMNRANTAIIGNELINFSQVEQLSETQWKLSGFLRGRKGTSTAGHAAGERFVLMDLGSVEYIDMEQFDLNRPLTFRITSISREGPDEVETLTIVGKSQQERQPAYLHARRSGGQVLIDWQGVGRTGGGTAVGMGQFFTGYRVTVNSVVHDTNARSLTVTDPGGTVTITVAQVNSITGAGPVASITI